VHFAPGSGRDSPVLESVSLPQGFSYITNQRGDLSGDLRDSLVMQTGSPGMARLPDINGDVEIDILANNLDLGGEVVVGSRSGVVGQRSRSKLEEEGEEPPGGGGEKQEGYKDKDTQGSTPRQSGMPVFFIHVVGFDK